MKLKEYAKAIVGGIVTALSTVMVALADNAITQTEWITIVLAFIAGTGFVYAVPNAPTGAAKAQMIADAETIQQLMLADK